MKLDDAFFSTVDGTMSAGDRNIRLREFEQSSPGVISNARCLTEGIDVPLIDSIYFVDPKNSLVDIVQACGRALRKPRNASKGDSYFILPVIIDSNTDVNEFDDERFETIHNVIQALRDQDERLADWVDNINIGVARGQSGSKMFDGPIEILLPKEFDLKAFADSIQLRIARINREPTTNEVIREVIRRSKHQKTFMPFGDYGFDTYLNQLVTPTIEKFENENIELPTEKIKVNHNNVSHTLRVGLIEKKDDGLYKLTPLGSEFKNGKISFAEVMKKSMLNFESKLAEKLYPYRTILKVLLKVEKFNYIEFLYGLYTIPDSSESSLNESVNIIQEIRKLYPNISILNKENKIKVLEILNKKYGLDFSLDEAWGSTTSKNKFLYFKNHLALFDEIKVKGDEIMIQEGSKEKIKELLDTLEKN